MIKASARAMRIQARPNGRNPGPGCFSVPMAKRIELQAVTIPIIRRMYPVTRSHFSMGFAPFDSDFRMISGSEDADP